MAVDIYAIGGGEIIYQVLSAVTLLLNGNGGILHALVTVGISMAAILVYFLCLSGTVEYIMKHWAIPLGLIMSFAFVPTMTVWVHDEVSQFHKKLNHVPLGIAEFSSHITTMSKNITSVIEMGFSGPDDLKYHKAGYLFGADILEKAREFKIR